MRSQLCGGHSSVSLSVSAESEKLWLSHMRTQFAWACIAQGALFESHQIMAICFPAAILECLSVHRRDASAVVFFCLRKSWLKKASRHGEKRHHAMEPSMPRGCKHACRHRAHSLASCAGSMLFARGINKHMLFPPPNFVSWLIFFVFPCLSLVSSPSLSHPLSLCNCQYLLSLSQSLSTFFPLLFLFSSYLFSFFPLLVSPISVSLISSFSPRAVRGSSGVFWIFHVLLMLACLLVTFCTQKVIVAATIGLFAC
jgi:hypothetical protein